MRTHLSFRSLRFVAVMGLALAIAAGSSALAACKRSPTRTTPQVLFAPPPGPITFDATMSSTGKASRGKDTRPFESALALSLDQKVGPTDPDGWRLLTFRADNVALVQRGRRIETTQTFAHQTRVDRIGGTHLIFKPGDLKAQKPVGRQETVDSVFGHIQPVYAKGRPTVGMSWDSTRPVPVLAGGDMLFKFHWKAVDRATVHERKAFRLAMTFEASSTTFQKEHYIITLATGRQKGGGTVFVDEETLEAIRADVSWDSHMTYTVKGLEKTQVPTVVVSKNKLLWDFAPGRAQDATPSVPPTGSPSTRSPSAPATPAA